MATTLPLTEEPVVTAPVHVPPYFAGLLPEGRRLIGLRMAVKTSADDDLTLLLAVGRDPVGDVQIVPAGQHPTPAEPLVQVNKAFEEVTFSEILEAAGVIDPVALAGVQDKASAGMISVPVGQAGKRYILKVDPPELPNVVENEAYFIRRAALARFPVVRAGRVHDATGRPGLLVERFDRVNGPDGKVVALAVEDAAQVMGLYPGDKYRTSAEEVAGALSATCAARALAARDIFRHLCFAWLTGNGDVHAKNISILAIPTGNGASRRPMTCLPRCPTAITPSRWRWAAGMTVSPANPSSPSLRQWVSGCLWVSRLVPPNEPWTTYWPQPIPSPTSSRLARCRRRTDHQALVSEPAQPA